LRESQGLVFYVAPMTLVSLILVSGKKAQVHEDSLGHSALKILGTIAKPINPQRWSGALSTA
jgi:hypothetical protein